MISRGFSRAKYIKGTHPNSSTKRYSRKKSYEKHKDEIEFCTNNCPYDDCIGEKCTLLKNLNN